MKIFETHSHYDDSAFDEDRDILLAEMFSQEGNIESIINVGASLRGCRESLELAAKYENVYASIGVHPEDIEALNDKEYAWIADVAKNNPKVVAIGEIGLDYHYPEPGKELQRECFRRQLRIAAEVGKPVIIHSRDACADTLECMKREHAKDIGGVIHCYSYTKEAAKDFLDMGFYFGIGGVVTFKNARKLVETVEYLPIEKILLETDCPYMAPEPNRGKRNDSRYIKYIAEKIAQIKGMDVQEVIDITNQNAKTLFLNL